MEIDFNELNKLYNAASFQNRGKLGFHNHFSIDFSKLNAKPPSKSPAAIELETTVMKIFREGITEPEAILEKLREMRGTYFEKTWGGYVPLFLERIKRIVSIAS